MLRMQSGIVFEWDEVGKFFCRKHRKESLGKTLGILCLGEPFERSPVDAAHHNDEIVQGNAAVASSSSCWLLLLLLLFSTRISSQEVSITSFP